MAVNENDVYSAIERHGSLSQIPEDALLAYTNKAADLLSGARTAPQSEGRVDKYYHLFSIFSSEVTRRESEKSISQANKSGLVALRISIAALVVAAATGAAQAYIAWCQLKVSEQQLIQPKSD